MKLSTMHQIFVASTIFLAFVLAIRGAFLFATRSSASELPLALAGLVVGSFAVAYLRKFRAKLRSATAAPPASDA